MGIYLSLIIFIYIGLIGLALTLQGVLSKKNKEELRNRELGAMHKKYAALFIIISLLLVSCAQKPNMLNEPETSQTDQDKIINQPRNYEMSNSEIMIS